MTAAFSSSKSTNLFVRLKGLVMLRVLGSRGASAGKLSARGDEISRAGEEARALPEHGWATPGVRGGHSPSSFRRPASTGTAAPARCERMDGVITANHRRSPQEGATDMTEPAIDPVEAPSAGDLQLVHQ